MILADKYWLSIGNLPILVILGIFPEITIY
jgi:hypothetical protein